MSRPSPRTRGLLALTACAALPLAIGVPAAPAAPVSDFAPGLARRAHQSPAHTIERLATTFDPATGAWSATIVFGATQSAETAGRLSVRLKLSDQTTTTAGWTARTDPAAPAAVYAHEGTLPGTPSAPATAVFDADRTVLTLTAPDPTLIGHDADYADATLQDAAGKVELSRAHAFLGATAPQARIPAAARHLTASRRGTLEIPLSPLPSKAQRTVSVYVPGARPIRARTLPADAYRRRSITVRIPAAARHRVEHGARRATLVVETTVPSGWFTIASKSVAIRLR